jgi:hypothetical protein
MFHAPACPYGSCWLYNCCCLLLHGFITVTVTWFRLGLKQHLPVTRGSTGQLVVQHGCPTHHPLLCAPGNIVLDGAQLLKMTQSLHHLVVTGPTCRLACRLGCGSCQTAAVPLSWCRLLRFCHLLAQTSHGDESLQHPSPPLDQDTDCVLPAGL